MPSLAYIYIRTPLGRATAFNTAAKLAPQIKTLLRAVDGKVTSTVLAAEFAHLGDVDKLLTHLESSGFIADRGAAFAKVHGVRDPDEVWKTGANPLVQPSLLTKQAIPGLPNHLATSTYAGALGSDWSPTSTSGLNEPVPAKPKTLIDSMVAQVVDWMATFILTYMPEKAFTELATIEAISTPEQLMADLPRYGALVNPLGPTGTQHLDELNQLIKKLFTPA